jgi:hypothetical protein
MERRAHPPPPLLTVTGPPPATVAPPRQRNTTAEPDFFSSPSTRSSGELAFRPPCPAGSLTVVGARPPLWHRRRPCRDACPGAVTAPTRCAAPSRPTLAEAGPASAGRARVAVGRAPVLCAWAEPTPQAWAKRHCASGPSVVSAQRHSN